MNWFEELFINEAKPALNRHSGSGGGGSSSEFEILGGILDRSCTELNLPGITNIVVNSIFSGNQNLVSANFPDLVSSPQSMLANCQNLETLNVPSMTTPGSMFMEGCKKIKRILLPAVNNNAGNAIFRNCTSLEYVDFSYIGRVGAYTRLSQNNFYGCSSLNTVILWNTSGIWSLQNTNNCFAGSAIESGTGFVYVPSALLDAYKSATNWSVYANQFRAIEDYPEICGGASA